MMDDLSMRQALERQKEAEREEEVQLAQGFEDYLREQFTDRELRLMANCIQYAEGDPAGLPGHNLMLIVAKLANLLGFDGVLPRQEQDEDDAQG